jgi:allantoinase
VEFDLLIDGGRVITATGVLPANILVHGGRIARVLPPDERPAAADRIDATGLHILPGLIDTHVHLRDPGSTDREDALSGTQAAAAGGVTTILEMPSSDPPVNSGDVLAARAAVLQARAIVDFALYGGAGHENLDAIPAQAAAGAVAFKTFLTAPAPGSRGYVGLWSTEEALRDVMAAVARTGLRHCLHCEHDAMAKAGERRLRDAGRVDGLAHAESRPPYVEDASVAMVLALAAHVGGPVQVVHMSSPRALDMVAAARTRGIDVTAETCPQYLFLTEDALREHGPFAKCNPPLRHRDDVAGMWRHVREDHIDVLGTDHAPHLPESMMAGQADIFRAPAGLPGLEVMLPLMLTAAHRGQVTLPQIVRLTSARAAAIFRLPGKGAIEPGRDADLVLADTTATWAFDCARCFSKSRGSMRVYQGMTMHGRIVSTLVRGVRVYDQGRIVADQGHGRFLRPAPAPEASAP